MFQSIDKGFTNFDIKKYRFWIVKVRDNVNCFCQKYLIKRILTANDLFLALLCSLSLITMHSFSIPLPLYADEKIEPSFTW